MLSWRRQGAHRRQGVWPALGTKVAWEEAEGEMCVKQGHPEQCQHQLTDCGKTSFRARDCLEQSLWPQCG